MLLANPLFRVLCLLAAFVSLSGCATGSPDLQTMLINLSSTYPNLWRMATAIAYVMGFSFAMGAIYKLKVYGEARTMMSSHASLKGPIVYLVVAAALIFSPAAYQTLLLTTFGDPNTTPLSWGGSIKGWSQAGTEAMLGLIQVVGVIAFIRGWVLMARTAEQAQPGTFGKAMTHIIGGLLAINIVGTKDILWNSLGLGS